MPIHTLSPDFTCVPGLSRSGLKATEIANPQGDRRRLRPAPPISRAASGSTAVLEYSSTETLPLLGSMWRGFARLCRPCRPASSPNRPKTWAFSGMEVQTRRETDCLLEGDGFELPVREHRAMAPSHGFAAASHREASLRGAPASDGETAFRGAAGSSVRRAAAMRSTHREMRCSAAVQAARYRGAARRAAMRAAAVKTKCRFLAWRRGRSVDPGRADGRSMPACTRRCAPSIAARADKNREFSPFRPCAPGSTRRTYPSMQVS